MPAHVQVAMAGSVREGLLALAVGAGMQVMAAMMEESVTCQCQCSPAGGHQAPSLQQSRPGKGD
ncbi:hypothetical protein GCM10010191_87910 [Actinomadura vinacea]|uniref:Uncharacterized protein n=1 Tax=Actinomadura vinacea TaxID=115336 RepID=A0ABN3KBT1_9ACTN